MVPLARRRPVSRPLRSRPQPERVRSLVSASATCAPGEATVVPLPYSLPPVPYRPGDMTWCGDVATSSDAADRHGFTPAAPARGSFYGKQSVSRRLAEKEAKRA